jgi:hypothetical protein
MDNIDASTEEYAKVANINLDSQPVLWKPQRWHVLRGRLEYEHELLHKLNQATGLAGHIIAP